ncbi:DUF6185 family protein [Streptomyces sp. NPDC050597]
MILLCVLGISEPAVATVAAADGTTDFDTRCATDRLRGSRAEASVRLQHDGRVHTKVTSELVVHVPSGWPLAYQLLLSEDSELYRQAVACLLRGESPGDAGGDGRYAEWRSAEPEVSPEKGGLSFRATAYSWIDTYDDYNDMLIGPWRIRVGADSWQIGFEPSGALDSATWKAITVDPGSSGAADARPAPTTGKGTASLVWKPGADESAPEISVTVEPDWQRSLAAQHNRPLFSFLSGAGDLLSQLVVAVLLLYAARLERRRNGGGAGQGQLDAEQRKAVDSLRVWAWITLLLALLVDGDDMLFEMFWWDVDIGMYVTQATGVLLLVFARPARGVVCAGAVLFLPAFLALLLWSRLTPFRDAVPYPFSGWEDVVATFVVQGCVVGLCLLGFAAAGWRLARDGGLLSGGFPLRMRWTGPAVVLGIVFTAVCYVAASERNWRRVTWLRPHDVAEYGTNHIEYLADNAYWFAANGQNWLFAYTWVLTGTAILGVLRTAGRLSTGSPLGAKPDRLLLLVFFPVVIGLDLGWYAESGALSWVWLLAHMAALRLMVAVGSSRVVLCLPLDGSTDALGATMTGPRRTALMDRARRYREIHAKLRRLDQGQSDDSVLVRYSLEQELNGLHSWSDSSGQPCRLPPRISVVDAALSLGPEDNWWANGKRGAALATVFGLPASVLATWAWSVRGDSWNTALHYGFGVPDVLLAFFYWQLGWTGAGFVLGALWRRLPGRRGPVKALPVAGAFGLPIGLDALARWVMNESQNSLVLYVVTMLLVLTLTGIALDLESFRGENRYWQSRLGLLLSLYQMRFLSLQIAYLVVQILGMITIWEFFADAGGPPPSELRRSEGETR